MHITAKCRQRRVRGPSHPANIELTAPPESRANGARKKWRHASFRKIRCDTPALPSPAAHPTSPPAKSATAAHHPSISPFVVCVPPSQTPTVAAFKSKTRIFRWSLSSCRIHLATSRTVVCSASPKSSSSSSIPRSPPLGCTHSRCVGVCDLV